MKFWKNCLLVVKGRPNLKDRELSDEEIVSVSLELIHSDIKLPDDSTAHFIGLMENLDALLCAKLATTKSAPKPTSSK